MFKVGQEYLTNAGLKVHILCNDAAYRATKTGPVCNVIGAVTQISGMQNLHYYDDAGFYAGVPTMATYHAHSIVSDEPNAEEAILIADIFGLVENGATERGSREQVLKIIRKLRTK